MTLAFTIRTAMLSDAPGIAALSDVLGFPVTETAMAQRLHRLLERHEDTVIVAALFPGRVVEWVHGAAQNLLESGRRCEIMGLVVDPQHRTQGIGRYLVTAVEAWATRQGLEQVTVRSNILQAAGQ